MDLLTSMEGNQLHTEQVLSICDTAWNLDLLVTFVVDLYMLVRQLPIVNKSTTHTKSVTAHPCAT
jgi:hypothetical protein